MYMSISIFAPSTSMPISILARRGSVCMSIPLSMFASRSRLSPSMVMLKSMCISMSMWTD